MGAGWGRDGGGRGRDHAKDHWIDLWSDLWEDLWETLWEDLWNDLWGVETAAPRAVGWFPTLPLNYYLGLSLKYNKKFDYYLGLSLKLLFRLPSDKQQEVRLFPGQVR